jgi:tetratricopeptide (TPR) repeat protein/tRNA A-37 threonylcarbamoyl transferase component Bud32
MSMPIDSSERWDHEARLDAVVTEFLDAVGDGLVPDRQSLLATHPDLAPELEEFFDAQDRVAFLTAPLRAVARAATLPHIGARPPLDVDDAIGWTPDPRLTDVLESRGYELLDENACGRKGVVYKARHRRLNRFVAVKTIGVGRQVTPNDVQRFRIEAETLGRLKHPNIVPVYEVAERDGRLFLFMPYMEGGSLAEKLAAYCDDPRAAVRLVATIAGAVHDVHRHAILHRDLKPSNILLDCAGEPHVSDFGLAKRLDADSGLTVSGEIVGTPSFMAPEQVEGRRAAPTTSTDVYGLGAILYSLLTGRPPFRGETPLDTIAMVRSTAPVRPRMHNPRVDRDLETICLKCLEKEPTARYGSAKALVDDLERWLRGEPIAARPVGTVVKGWRWARRNKAIAGLLGLVVVLLIAGFVGLAASYATISRTNAELKSERDQARRAFDETYTLVADGLLEDIPGKEGIRLDYLNKALDYYEREAAQGNASDAPTRTAWANAYFRVGRIYKLLSRSDRAEVAYNRAVALLEGLVREFPSVPDDRVLLALTLKELGVLNWAKTRRPEAERLYHRALDALGNRAEDRDRADFRDVTAKVQHNLGILYQENKDFPAAASAYSQAIEAHRKLTAEFPGPLYRHAVALDICAMAGFLGDPVQTHPKEAEEAFREAIEIEQGLAAEFAGVSEYQTRAADLLQNLADFLTRQGRHDEAEAALRPAHKLRQALVSRFPDVPDYKARLGGVLSTRAAALCERGRFPAACELLAQARVQIQFALKAVPGHTMYLDWLRGCDLVQAEALLLAGDPTGATKAAEAAICVLPDDPASFLEVARVWARCLARIEQQTRLSGAERQALAKTLGPRAVESLNEWLTRRYRQGVEAAQAEIRAIQVEKEFDVIRQRADYKAMIRELGVTP